MTEPLEVFEIDDAGTLEMLADPVRCELIERLIDPASVSEVARAMGVPRTRLYHHVRLLEAAGMIKVVQTRKRGAIPESVYRVAARNFKPSARLLAESPPRQVVAAVMDSVLSVTRADITRSFMEGRVGFDEAAGHRRAMLTRNVVVLSRERMRQLITELTAVLDRYNDDDPGGDPVAFVAMVYPSSRSAP
jgi:DNA-binding transcriptional ArsR family regulator